MALNRLSALLVFLLFLSACASNLPDVPYPVGMQSSEIPDSFLAELPGTRAKILTMDGATRRYSMLLQLPTEWDFTTGGAPDKSTELYVLEGTIELGEFTLDKGGYAYLPPGSLGVRMKSDAGALLLYYIDDVADDAVIQTPIISNSNLLDWRPSSGIDATISTKELRFDPGSGAKTWLVEIPTGATEDWESTSADQEGFMISGQYAHDECVEGIAVPTDYLSGGYFYRPAGNINGGSASTATVTTIWFMRVASHAAVNRNELCAGSPAN